MSAGSILYQGMSLISPSGQYKAKMQFDGNFVIYNGNQETGTAVWATSTSGNYLAHFTLQTDGNLIVFSSTGAVSWASNAYGGYNASLLSLKM
jgi:hypothetical protein